MTDTTEMMLAKAFSATLRDWLTDEQMFDVLKRNAAQDNPNICHTHDFCDANEAMAEAFQKVLSRDVDIGGQHDMDRWNKAWNLAKHNGFFIGSETAKGRLTVGTRVMTRRTVERGNGLVVMAGNLGTVVEFDGENGFIEVKMDRAFPWLAEWDNRLVWSTNEDTLKDIGIDLMLAPN